MLHLAKLGDGGNLGPTVVGLHVVPQKDVPSQITFREIKLQERPGSARQGCRRCELRRHARVGTSICLRMAISCSFGSLNAGVSSRAISKPVSAASEGRASSAAPTCRNAASWSLAFRTSLIGFHKDLAVSV